MNKIGVGVVAILLLADYGAVRAETLLERGTYLMREIVACGNCHTAPAGPLKNKELSGGLKWDERPFTTYATNNYAGSRNRHRKLERRRDHSRDPRG